MIPLHFSLYIPFIMNHNELCKMACLHIQAKLKNDQWAITAYTTHTILSQYGTFFFKATICFCGFHVHIRTRWTAWKEEIYEKLTNIIKSQTKRSSHYKPLRDERKQQQKGKMKLQAVSYAYIKKNKLYTFRIYMLSMEFSYLLRLIRCFGFVGLLLFI